MGNNADDEHNGIVTMRNQREDQGPEFGYLESLSYHPWLGGATRTLDTLYTRLQEFQTDSRQLLALNSALQCEQRTEPCAAASSAAPSLKMVRHSGHWVYMPGILGQR